MLPAAPIVHPALCGYPCPELCATAVADKLAQALLEASGADAPRLARLTRDLDLVALATVADVVPLLRREPRARARAGCARSPRRAKPGLRALMAVAGVDAAASRRAGDRLPSRAAPERRRPPLPRRHRPRAAADRRTRRAPEQIAASSTRANSERRQIETRIRFEAEAQMAELGPRDAYVLAGEAGIPA